MNPRPTALIVHAHPEPSSFSTAQARTAATALTAVGHDVTTIDLYARRWQPVLRAEEFGPAEPPFKPQREQSEAVRAGTLSPDVREDLAAVLAADLLVLSFPLWWFSVPAVLKGWIDRVFVMGGVFGGDLGYFDAAALAGRRALVLTTTGGGAEAYASDDGFGRLDDFLFHIHRGMLEFVGYDVLEPVVTYGPAHLDVTQRAAALDDVADVFAGVADRQLAATSRRKLVD